MRRWRIVVSLAVALAVPQLAEATEHEGRIAVRYADLDLSLQTDVRRLHARVQRAIRTLCAQPRLGTLATPAESLCRRTAMATAQGQIERAVALVVNRSNLVQGRIATAAAR